MPKVKAHLKIHVSIANHRNTAVMWSNLTSRAIYCELGRLAIDKYAAKTGDTFHLSTLELMAITGCRTAASATVRWRYFIRSCEVGAAYLGGTSPLRAKYVGGHWIVTWRNFAKKQGFTPKFGSVIETPEAEAEAKAKAKAESKSRAPKEHDKLPPPEWCFEEVDHLMERVCARISIKPLTKQARSVAARTISKIDATPAQITYAIEWLFSPDNETEFRVEVQCANTLRRKWPTIISGIQRTRRPVEPQKSRTKVAIEAALKRVKEQGNADGEQARHASGEGGEDDRTIPGLFDLSRGRAGG